MLEVTNRSDTLVIPTLLSLRQENGEFWLILSQVARLNPAWAILGKGKGYKEEKGSGEMAQWVES